MNGIDLLINLTDKLGIIDIVKSKLIKQPDPAAEKMAIALEEMAKIYGAINSELIQYLSIWFDETGNASDRGREYAILIGLEGGEIKARLGKARGHCKKIGNIYNKFLSPWFHQLLSPEESGMMTDLFMSLDEFDGIMLDTIDALVSWLTDKAQRTLELVDNEMFVDANNFVRDARKEILPQRHAISDALSHLYELEAAFIDISGVV